MHRLEFSQRLHRLKEWLLPGTCLLCQTHIPRERDFCSGCDTALPRLAGTCHRCAAPALGTSAEVPCGACQENPPSFVRTRALFRYAAPIDGLIQNGKYNGRLDSLAALGRQLSLAMAPAAPDIDALVPVPLHRSRLRERGYNHSLELARVLATRLDLLIQPGVERARPTTSQTGLSRDERRRNVRDAFLIRSDVADRRLAIVDDVMTSGATAEALARCLMAAGAKAVEVWIVARA